MRQKEWQAENPLEFFFSLTWQLNEIKTTSDNTRSLKQEESISEWFELHMQCLWGLLTPFFFFCLIVCFKDKTLAERRQWGCWVCQGAHRARCYSCKLCGSLVHFRTWKTLHRWRKCYGVLSHLLVHSQGTKLLVLVRSQFDVVLHCIQLNKAKNKRRILAWGCVWLRSYL